MALPEGGTEDDAMALRPEVLNPNVLDAVSTGIEVSRT